jgi:flagellar biosynthetic protein FliS
MRGIAEYKTVALESSDQRKLVVLCFETLIRRQEQAKAAFVESRFVDGVEAIRICREIFCELLLAIDYDASPEMGSNLAGLYDWCIRTLAEVGKTHDGALLDQTLKVTKTLHEGFCVAFGDGV